MPSERSCACASASELCMATARLASEASFGRAPVVDAQHHQGGVESRPPLRPTGVFLAVVRRRDRHRRAPGGADVDGLQAVAPHPPGQVAHEGARRVATAAEPTARCSTGVRRAPKNSSAMARSCSSHCSVSSADLGAGARASNSSARRRAVRRWTGMLPRSISRLGVSMVLSISTHHHGQSEP